MAAADLDLRKPSSVRNALVPGFDKEGRLSWELRAIEVAPRSDKLTKPLSHTLSFSINRSSHGG